MMQKLYVWILKFGSFAALISVFLINTSYLFPYITSKQLYFNVLVELLLIFWAGLIIKYPDWRPKKSYITYGLVAFFSALLISSFTGVDFNLSFWGDIERMLGVFHLLHFFAFYIIVITVFRDKQDWKYFFMASIAAASCVAIYNYMTVPYSTLGNTAYVSGYMIFNIYFAAMLFVGTMKTTWFSKISDRIATVVSGGSGIWFERSFYIIAVALMLGSFVRANTTGALVGFSISIGLVFLLLTILTRNKKLRIVGIVSMVLFVAAISFVLLTRNTLLANTKIGSMARNVSSQKVTFQTRLISWKAAAQDFPNHPIFGTGYGNYAITFDKFFDPKFYNYTRGETYFDHAHNNVIDITTTTGLLGILAYLSIFVAFGYYMITGYRKGKISLYEFVLTIGLFTAYFIQNLAVFDSMVTYMSLMMLLGYVYWLTNRDHSTILSRDRAWDNNEIYTLTVVGLIMLTLVYQFGYKVDRMLVWTIEGQKSWSQGSIDKTLEAYKQALSYGTPLDRDSRSSFVRLFSSGQAVFRGMDSKKAQGIIDYAVDLSRKNVALSPHDSLEQMQLAQILMVGGQVFYNDQAKAKYYNDQAMDAINKSIDASPRRIPIFYVKAQIYLALGNKEKAIETLKYAETLNTDYYDSFCQLANVYLYYKDEKNGFASMNECLDKGGAELISPEGYTKSLIGHYADKKDWSRVIKLYERLGVLTPKDANVWADLAKLYAQTGDKVNAKQAALKAADLYPAYQKDVEEFIKKLDAQK